MRGVERNEHSKHKPPWYEVAGPLVPPYFLLPIEIL